MSNETKDIWEKITIVSGIVSAFLVPLVGFYGYYFTNQYNQKQLEISKRKIIAEIIPKFVPSGTDLQKRRVNTLSAALFQENPIPPIISFLQDEDEKIRKAAASALEMIGKECAEPLSIFIINNTIPARYKAEAIISLERLDKDKSLRVRKNLVDMMSKEHVSSETEIDYYIHPFIASETIMALYKLKVDLRNVYLAKIDLSFNNLEGIQLRGSNLRGTNLRGTILKDAIFEDAEMEGANLDGADITNGNFKNARLKDAIFSGVTGFDTADFSGATGIDDLLDSIR